MAAAPCGEAAGPQAAIVIVCREPRAREILRQELSKRYGADYQIVVCDRPAELAPWMRDLRAAGLPVALVIGGVGAQDPDGIEVLAAIRAIDPVALRVAAVRWGDWQSIRPIFDAVTLGKIDHWVTRPVQTPAEEFHHSVTEFLRERNSQPTAPATAISSRWYWPTPPPGRGAPSPPTPCSSSSAHSHGRNGLATASHATNGNSSSPDRTCPPAPAMAGLPAAHHCRWKPACPGCSPLVTCATDRSKGSLPR